MANILVQNPAAPEPPPSGKVNPLAQIRESRAGVLENTKQHAQLLMERIVSVMGERYGVVHTMTRHKPVSGPAATEDLEEFARSVDWVIVGSAD